MKKPPHPSTCDHGRRGALNCPECQALSKKISGLVKPLADEFWEHLRKGNRSIEHMLSRAYRMGMKHTEDNQ